MKPIKKAAKKVMDTLTEGLTSPGQSKKIDTSNGAFMAVSVENVGSCPCGPLFSVAHYYEQNGDLMRDPDIVFFRSALGDYFPISYRQDGLGINSEYVEFLDGGRYRIAKRAQADCAVFSGQWMANIKEQQDLELQPA